MQEPYLNIAYLMDLLDTDETYIDFKMTYARWGTL